MGTHTIKSAENSLYSEDPVQNPYFTGIPETCTYIGIKHLALKLMNSNRRTSTLQKAIRY